MTVRGVDPDDSSRGLKVEGVLQDGDGDGQQVSFRDDDDIPPARPRRASMFVANESFLDSSQPHLFEDSYHPDILRVYHPPKQRQRWVREPSHSQMFADIC